MLAKTAEPGPMRVAIGKKEGGVISSCNLTSRVIINLLWKNPSIKNPAQQIPELNPAEQVNVIMDLLKKKNLVILTVYPNHYFTLIPIDKDKLSIMQSFEDVYNLYDWIKNRDNGYMRLADFKEHMLNFFSGNAGQVKKAALYLFSYELTNAKGDVKAEITKYFNVEKCGLKGWTYIAL